MLPAPPARERAPAVTPATVFDVEIVSAWDERVRRRRELMERGPRFIAPSMLAKDAIKEPRETEPKDRSEDEKDRDLQEDTERALGATEGAAGVAFVGSSSARQRGSLVHEVLHRCDLDDVASVRPWARRLCARRGLPEIASDVEREAHRILESEAMVRVRRAKSVQRELPVAWFDKENETYVEGFVDLAFEEDDGWVLVDYKTDRVRGQEAAIVSRYTPQLEAYARALAAAGLKIKQRGLWFTETGALSLT